jgi:hypothetical protein
MQNGATGATGAPGPTGLTGPAGTTNYQELTNIPAFGNFAYLSSITSANISTYIEGAAIGTAYISDGNITTAKIQNAAITRAKIGDLAVDTLQIAGNAIVIPVAGQFSNWFGIAGDWWGQWVTAMTLSVNMTGSSNSGRVLIMADLHSTSLIAEDAVRLFNHTTGQPIATFKTAIRNFPAAEGQFYADWFYSIIWSIPCNYNVTIGIQVQGSWSYVYADCSLTLLGAKSSV